MFTMILLCYLQQHGDVSLESTSLRGTFQTKKACEAAARRAREPLTTPDGYAAAWRDAMCTAINRGVTVNEAKQGDLGKLLQGRRRVVCEGTGAWRRVQELCAPAAGGKGGNGGKR